MNILKVLNICKKYNDNLILNNLNLDIKKGDFTVIMGRSGAGKSTLIYAISCLTSIDSGEIYLNDKCISDYTENQLASIRRKEFSFIFQEPNLIDNLTCFDNVKISYDNPDEEQIKNLFAKFHIENTLNKYPSDLSGGEGSRVAIVRAIIKKPKVLFLDEPTGALNKHYGDEVLDILEQLNNEGYTIIMVTHDIKASIRGKNVLYLEDGKIIDNIDLKNINNMQTKIDVLNEMLNKNLW